MNSAYSRGLTFSSPINFNGMYDTSLYDNSYAYNNMLFGNKNYNYGKEFLVQYKFLITAIDILTKIILISRIINIYI